MPYLTIASEIKTAIAKFSQAKILWLDTEIAEYQSKTPRLSLIQVLADFADFTEITPNSDVYILDVLEQPELVEYFIVEIMATPQIEKVFHNSGYDIRFLGNDQAQNITCTLKMARKIPYYLLPLPNLQLKTLIEQFCHTPYVDKEEQGGDWGKRPLTEKQLQYATMDAVYLAQVHQRLLEIINEIHPDPGTDDLIVLGQRYQELEENWKLLDSEITELKDRMKIVMQAKNQRDNLYFKLSSSTIKKVDFLTLANLTKNQKLELNFPVTLTKELQKQLGTSIHSPSLEVEEVPIWRLTTKVQRRKSTKKTPPDPVNENIKELGERYREILPRWKLMDSEIEHLKERVKKAMMVQNIKETSDFKLSNSSSLKVDFASLAKLMESTKIELDFPVTLTQDIQKRLGEAIAQIEVQIEYIISWRLTAKTLENEDEDIPF